MPANRTRPRYRYTFYLLVPTIRVLFGIRSSLSHDAALLLRGANPPPRVLNAHNIPTDSSFIVVYNHYDRPGLGAWWGIAPIATTIAAQRTREPREVHFMMAREWHYARGFDRWVKQPFTRWLFGRFAKTYGCIGLPPALLDTDEYRGQGTSAIRRAIELTRRHPPELIGLSPEGNTGENLGLCQPPRGAGLMLWLLARDTIPLLPVGIFEDDDQILTVNFGVPFTLQVSPQLSKLARDVESARQVMIRIGMLLPERMWGVYRHEIQSARRSSRLS